MTSVDTKCSSTANSSPDLAEIEKSLVDPDLIEAQDLAPDVSQSPLTSTGRRDVGLLHLRSLLIRFWKRFSIYFFVGC